MNVLKNVKLKYLCKFFVVSVFLCFFASSCADSSDSFRFSYDEKSYSDTSLPFLYNNTLYRGQITAGSGNINDNETGTVFSYPLTTDFKCDGYFSVKGTLPDCRVHSGEDWNGKKYECTTVPYIRFTIVKDEYLDDVSLFTMKHDFRTYEFYSKSFDARLWLPEGKGYYTVYVSVFYGEYNHGTDDKELKEALALYNDPKSHKGTDSVVFPLRYGDFIIKVENVRDERGSGLYPSQSIQSDVLKLAEYAAETASGISDKRSIFDLVNRQVVSCLTYDSESASDKDNRRMQDALTCYESHLGLCVGYSRLTAALLRFNGIKCYNVLGSLNGVGHEWIMVNFDDGEGWFFYEPQSTNKGLSKTLSGNYSAYRLTSGYINESHNADEIKYAIDWGA